MKMRALITAGLGLMILVSACMIEEPVERSLDGDTMKFVLKDGSLISTDNYNEINPQLYTINYEGSQKTALFYATDDPRYDGTADTTYTLNMSLLHDSGEYFLDPVSVDTFMPGINDLGDIVPYGFERGYTFDPASVRYYTFVDRSAYDAARIERPEGYDPDVAGSDVDPSVNGEQDMSQPLLYFTRETADGSGIWCSDQDGVGPVYFVHEDSYYYLNGEVLGSILKEYKTEDTDNVQAGNDSGEGTEAEKQGVLQLIVKVTDVPGNVSDLEVGDIVMLVINISVNPYRVWDYKTFPFETKILQSGSVFDPSRFQADFLVPGILFSAKPDSETLFNFYFQPLVKNLDAGTGLPPKLSSLSTAGNDQFPFLAPDGDIFFSSDFFTGGDNYDLFRWKHKDWNQIDIPEVGVGVDLVDPLADIVDNFRFVIKDGDISLLEPGVLESGLEISFTILAEVPTGISSATIGIPVNENKTFYISLEPNSAMTADELAAGYTHKVEFSPLIGTSIVIDSELLGKLGVTDSVLVTLQNLRDRIQTNGITFSISLVDSWGRNVTYDIKIPAMDLPIIPQGG